jgi:hypothetical protein
MVDYSKVVAVAGCDAVRRFDEVIYCAEDIAGEDPS